MLMFRRAACRLDRACWDINLAAFCLTCPSHVHRLIQWKLQMQANGIGTGQHCGETVSVCFNLFFFDLMYASAKRLEIFGQ